MSSITIRLDSEMANAVDELATALDRSRSWVATDALRRYLEDERRWLEDVKAGIAELDRGEGLPHEEVMARAKARIQSS